MTDRQLSRNFWLHEFPCWQRATEADVAALQEFVARVLQPIRNVFGAVIPTSWKWWRDGCTPRTGPHAYGAVDFVLEDGRNRDAWEWGNTHLMPAGYIARWIFEPDTVEGNEHIHGAPRTAQLQATGSDTIQSLVLTPEGDMYVFQEWAAGTFANPYQLPGITAYATAGLPWWAGWALLFGIFAADMTGQAHGGLRIKGV